MITMHQETTDHGVRLVLGGQMTIQEANDLKRYLSEALGYDGDVLLKKVLP